MHFRLMKPKQRAFTLAELLIVVIILAILAAIIVPQFSSATVDAQESALDANLTGLRSAIELYHAQHGVLYPGRVATGGGRRLRRGRGNGPRQQRAGVHGQHAHVHRCGR